MVDKIAVEFLCDNCGAEYTLKYDGEEVIDDPLYCPFCSNELDSYDVEELQIEMDFDDD